MPALRAYDHVSRQVMRAAFHARPELRPLLPYAHQFYSTASAYTWTGVTYHIGQAGGEQGDPLMPALYIPLRSTLCWKRCKGSCGTGRLFSLTPPGDWALPPAQQGLTVLVTPFGRDD